MKRMFLIIISIVFFCSGCTTNKSSELASEPTKQLPMDELIKVIKVRVTDFPPQYYLDENGEWTGLDVELTRALVEGAGYKVEFVEMPWSRALQEIQVGSIDVMSNLSITSEREEFMHFIGPSRRNDMGLVVHRDYIDIPIEGLDDFVLVASYLGKNFGIQSGAIYSSEFNAKLNEQEFAKYFEAVTDASTNITKTLSGRIVGFFEDRFSIKYKLSTNPELANLKLHSFTFQGESVYFGVSKVVSDEVLKDLIESFERLSSEGVFDSILDRYR